MVKLNLGCGDKILPGYVNADAASQGQAGSLILLPIFVI